MDYFPISLVLWNLRQFFSPSGLDCSPTMQRVAQPASEASERLVGSPVCLGAPWFVSMLSETILAVHIKRCTNVHTLSSTPVSRFQKDSSKEGNNYMHKAVSQRYLDQSSSLITSFSLCPKQNTCASRRPQRALVCLLIARRTK